MSQIKNSKNIIIFSSLTLVLIVAIGIITVANFNRDEKDREDIKNSQSLQEENTKQESNTDGQEGGTSETELQIEIKNDLKDDSEIVKSNYQDGSFSATGTYSSPDGIDEIEVFITLNGGIIESVSVETNPKSATGDRHQQLFAEGIAGEVVGQSIDEVEVGRVNGSSLTGEGFNRAITNIREQASN